VVQEHPQTPDPFTSRTSKLEKKEELGKEVAQRAKEDAAEPWAAKL